MGKYSSARRGIFKPKNPSKWVNSKIIHRSGLERKWFTLFDLDPSVLAIGSENVVVPYFDPVKQKVRKYYVDVVLKYKDRDGNIKIKLIEIKCFSESCQPKKPKRLTEAFRSSVMTFVTNEAKWEAATKYAKARGWEFTVLTERHLT
jgi:hypothetical protein